MKITALITLFTYHSINRMFQNGCVHKSRIFFLLLLFPLFLLLLLMRAVDGRRRLVNLSAEFPRQNFGIFYLKFPSLSAWISDHLYLLCFVSIIFILFFLLLLLLLFFFFIRFITQPSQRCEIQLGFLVGIKAIATFDESRKMAAFNQDEV